MGTIFFIQLYFYMEKDKKREKLLKSPPKNIFSDLINSINGWKNGKKAGPYHLFLIDAKHHYTLGNISSQTAESNFLKCGAIFTTQKHGIGPWLLYFSTDWHEILHGGIFDFYPQTFLDLLRLRALNWFYDFWNYFFYSLPHTSSKIRKKIFGSLNK